MNQKAEKETYSMKRDSRDFAFNLPTNNNQHLRDQNNLSLFPKKMGGSNLINEMQNRKSLG